MPHDQRDPHDPHSKTADPDRPARDWDDLGWADDPGLDDRQFAMEDADPNPPELPPAVTGAPPQPAAETPAPDGAQGGPHAG
ncbi:hypothetical protein [Streptomyces sp. NPDC047014]|uniref:hypothetical protein n=1 Tax=Streptomyces sp. NPDC047014 TaxID=3155736 RepID=UPI0033F41CEA